MPKALVEVLIRAKDMTATAFNGFRQRWAAVSKVVTTAAKAVAAVTAAIGAAIFALTKLGDLNPALPEQDMAFSRPVAYQSRDGLLIHGYLTLPQGRAARCLPVVVHPHGGPWARDHWGYDPQVQFLANRGYAVLQTNFSGSTGYGRAFWEAGFGQWGLAMQDDISDGVQWLIDQRIAELADWRGTMLAHVRELIRTADPDVVEEWKWRGVPTWYHDGIICTGETYKNVVKLTFAKGARLDDPAKLFNSSLDGNVRRAIDIREGDKIAEALFREAAALNGSRAER